MMIAELRSLEQNRKLHAMIRDIASQVEWAGERMEEDEWKLLLLAAAYGQKIIPNPFGGTFIVKNNRRSSGLFKPEMADLITQIQVFGDERGVKWTDPEWLALIEDQKKIA